MAACQALYDVCLFFHFVWAAPETWINALWTSLSISSTLAVTFYTNVLSYVIVYVVVTGKLFDILLNFRVLWGLVLIPSIILGIIAFVLYVEADAEGLQQLRNTYYWLRIISIFFNMVGYIVVMYKAYRLRGSRISRTNTQTAIFVLASRMIYYPMVQV
jgi:hypothetical protein